MTPDDRTILLSTLRAGLERSLMGATEDQWIAFATPVPAGHANALTDGNFDQESVFFCSGEGSNVTDHGQPSYAYVGAGALASRRFEGAARFADAELFIKNVFAQGLIPAALVPHVRFFGGAAFSPGRDGHSVCWSEFGDARFILPRCIYVDGAEAQLICLAHRRDLDATISLAEQLLHSLTIPPSIDHAVLKTIEQRESEGTSSWHAMVEAIKGEIEAGAVAKIVAARRMTLELSEEPRRSTLLARLNSQAPLCARFALRVGQKTFLGATPERLIRKEGRMIETEALAGSISTQGKGAARSLLESRKNREEHAVVVDAIRAGLEPMTEDLSVAPKPEIRRLRKILHLRTPISGHLSADHHLLRLVAQLHPTPAVGGLPSRPAVEFIREHEQAERGWYAAPIGWVDSRGDGEFVVALRSGLLAENKVHLYAGAGIVADSDSDDEFAETELKLSGMLGALGLTAGGQSVRPEN